METEHLKSGLRIRGLVVAGEVTVVAVEHHSDGMANVAFRTDDGQISTRLVTAKEAAFSQSADEQRWAFDADGAVSKRPSTARRIQLAHTSVSSEIRVHGRRSPGLAA